MNSTKRLETRSKRSGFRPRLRRWIAKISRRSARSGRSTKKISSSRPLRSNSGGQLRNVIGRCHNKDRRGLFRKPRQKGSKDPRGRAPVREPGALRSGKGLVDLVHPKNRGRDRFGHRDRPADVFLRRPDQAPEHPAHIEAQQRQLPLRGHRLCAKALAATLDAQQQNPFGGGQAERTRFVGEGDRALVQPVFQDGESADVREAVVRGVVFQQTVFADDLLFFGENFIYISPAQALGFDDDFCENVFGFAQRQAQGGLQQPFAAFLAVADGTSVISENVYERRFKYVAELQRMGADIVQEGRTAIIKGVPSLQGAEVTATDLRAGAGLVIAGLAAEGETLIDRVYHIDRGYERIEEKLNQVGAKIARISESD